MTKTAFPELNTNTLERPCQDLIETLAKGDERGALSLAKDIRKLLGGELDEMPSDVVPEVKQGLNISRVLLGVSGPSNAQAMVNAIRERLTGVVDRSSIVETSMETARATTFDFKRAIQDEGDLAFSLDQMAAGINTLTFALKSKDAAIVIKACNLLEFVAKEIGSESRVTLDTNDISSYHNLIEAVKDSTEVLKDLQSARLGDFTFDQRDMISSALQEMKKFDLNYSSRRID